MDYEKIREDFIRTLFSESVLSKVRGLIESEEEKLPFEMYDTSFVLVRVTNGNINLEVMMQTTFGEGKSQNEPTRLISYLLPVGFYTWSGNMSARIVNIHVMHEYEDAVNTLNCEANLPTSSESKRLSFAANALIGAFSMDNLLAAYTIYEQIHPVNREDFPSLDKKVVSNGLKTEILISFDGLPQIFVRNNMNELVPVGGFPKSSEGVKCSPSRQFEDEFNYLYEMGLLSAFKGIF